MAIDLNHLSGTKAAEDVDFDNLPEQMGGFSDPPQPGAYRFEVPRSWSGANFEEYDDREGVKRLRVKFDQSAPLKIVQALDQQYLNTPFTTRLSNQARKRGKADDAPKASDLDYYLKGCKYEGPRPASNKAWAQAVIATGGKTFAADIEYSWHCNPDKNIFVDNGQGGFTEMDGANGGTAQKGCDTRYYQRDVQKVDGAFPIRVQCQCGASVRAFANLARFRE